MHVLKTLNLVLTDKIHVHYKMILTLVERKNLLLLKMWIIQINMTVWILDYI